MKNKLKNIQTFLDKTIIEFTLKPLYLLVSLSIISIFLSCYSIHEHKKEKIEIEKRLRDVCFLYNKECDHELGGCICEATAGEYDIMYIMNK